jgi:hypothetical protein
MAEWWPFDRSWADDWRRNWSDMLSVSSAAAASLGLPSPGTLPGDPFSTVMDAARAWLVGKPRVFRDFRARADPDADRYRGGML